MHLQADKPLPVAGQGIARSYFAEVVDRGPGKAALLRARKDVVLENEGLVATLDTWMYVRGGGGFGGPGGEGSTGAGPERIAMPDRGADRVCDLPLLYRLSLGDQNALHADPAHAKRVGFARPILHGIASFSLGVHAALREMLDYDPARIAGGQVRLSGPVFPGDTLRTELWRDGAALLFRTTAVERDTLVMDGGKLDLTD